VRVRDHVALSTAAALVLRPWAGRSVLGPWAASILIDADHYVWFSVRQRNASPLAAARYFGQAHPSNHPGTRALHTHAALLAALLLAARRRGALNVALGMCLHVALDARHEVRMDEARKAALARDDHTCQACGTRGSHVETHLWRQPLVLPSYQPRNLVSLCASCHETAHQRRRRSISELPPTLAALRSEGVASPHELPAGGAK
jgi:hypothetical protein